MGRYLHEYDLEYILSSDIPKDSYLDSKLLGAYSYRYYLFMRDGWCKFAIV